MRAGWCNGSALEMVGFTPGWCNGSALEVVGFTPGQGTSYPD
jgi:hypothetical protein